MEESELPEDVCALLCAHIESYEQLEILLELRRERTRSWSAHELSSRLHLSSPLAAGALASLQARSLVRALPPRPDPKYAYSPPSPAVDAAVGNLAQQYAEHPLRVIKLMSANAIERVRTAALHTFADAFILRKDKDRG